MVDVDFESKFRNCIRKIGEVGELYAEAKGQSWQAQELRSSVLASIVGKSEKTSIARAEVEAKSSEDYQQYVRETAEAIKKELRLKAEYTKWLSSFEALRSLSSLEKATRAYLE